MSNTFGRIFRLTTFGESHGPGIGGVIDGCPSQLRLKEEDIQLWLDKRRPKSDISTERNEEDQVKILSGVFSGFTTGTSIGFYVENLKQVSSDYDQLRDVFRPGHADYTYYKKYGIRDWRGGGRSSARETVSRVVGGAIASKILDMFEIEIYCGTSQLGEYNCDMSKVTEDDFKESENRPYWILDKNKIKKYDLAVEKARKQKDSIGGIVDILVKNVPIGLGTPVFDKLDARLAYALMGIGAVKGVEFGEGFKAADYTGYHHNDWIDDTGFKSNHAGGVLGGISSGQDIKIRVAVKPIPSIEKYQQTITKDGNSTEISTTGRHDISAIPRINIVLLSMTAITLADFILIHKTEKF